MKKLGLIIATLMVLSPAPALANKGDRLECRKTGSFSWGCKIARSQVAKQVIYSGQKFETAYRVDYSFVCSGHQMFMTLRSDQSSVALEQGQRRGSLTIVGSGPLEIVDQNPERTKGLTFMGPCQLTIQSVSASPSDATFAKWGESGKAQAKLLRSSLLLYLLARDYESLQSWSHDKLTQIRARLEKLAKASPDVIHYRVLLNAVVSALEDSPPLNTELELKEAAQSVSERFRSELDQQLSEAQGMVDRFEHFGREVVRELERALAEVQEEAG